MGHRRSARELVLQVLYSVEMTEEAVDTTLKDLSTRRRYTPETLKYADELSKNVVEHKEECNRLIRETVEHWEFSRIALLDRIILGMGICELLYGEEVPPRVAIDEAIELAKKYSTQKSSGFINGVLDAILKKKMSDLGPGRENLSLSSK